MNPDPPPRPDLPDDEDNASEHDGAETADAFSPAEFDAAEFGTGPGLAGTGGPAPPFEMEPFRMEAVPEGHRSGYVALVGAPNVGKSTLLNRLLGAKLAIVSPRPSTTRHRVLGILSADAAGERPPYQLVLLDTPGVVRPQYRLHDLMLQDVDRALADADVVLFLADATEARPSRQALTALDKIGGRPALLVLTKSDLLNSVADALPVAERYLAARPFEAVVPLSALTGHNVDALLGEVLARVPEGPPFYPRDQLSEHPERFFVSEIVREAIFNLFRDEVPYSTQVNVVQYEERAGRKDFVACDIVVERDSQKAILIGKGGQALKRLGAEARRGIEEFLGRGVFLQLFVKTRADWRNREGFLREYGYGR